MSVADRIPESPSGALFIPPPNRIRWTSEQCEKVVDAGILTGRYELIDGEILSKMGQKPAHAHVIRVMLAWLISVFGAHHVQSQLPIQVANDEAQYNQPEPDCAVLAQPASAYATRHPEPNDLLLVVEVSDSTLDFDQTVKAGLYARAGITDFWIIDLVHRRLLIYRDPQPEGYQDVIPYTEEAQVSPLARPDATIRVSDLLPPAS
jgi:Uma2 family endonuclease